jgi:nicotinate-nucleotide--dimethylbenzimidazole phosphoribosyltransferase
MTADCAVHAVQAGIALALSLGENDTDLIALGGVGAGSATSAAAVIAALCGVPASEFESDDAAIIAEALALHRPDSTAPLQVLAAVGGFEIGVLTGVILAASSIRIPVVLDDAVTVAAGLLAATLQPNVGRYLIASHTVPRGYRSAFDKLELEPLFGVRMSHGEGTGALLALPMIVAATGVVAELG